MLQEIAEIRSVYAEKFLLVGQSHYGVWNFETLPSREEMGLSPYYLTWKIILCDYLCMPTCYKCCKFHTVFSGYYIFNFADAPLKESIIGND